MNRKAGLRGAQPKSIDMGRPWTSGLPSAQIGHHLLHSYLSVKQRRAQADLSDPSAAPAGSGKDNVSPASIECRAAFPELREQLEDITVFRIGERFRHAKAYPLSVSRNTRTKNVLGERLSCMVKQATLLGCKYSAPKSREKRDMPLDNRLPRRPARQELLQLDRKLHFRLRVSLLHIANEDRPTGIRL